MKKYAASLIPLLPLLLLVLVLGGYAIFQSMAAQETTTEIDYRPALLYEDELYLYTSETLFGEVSKDSLTYVATLASNVPSNQLPTENLQSCGCAELVNCGIYRTEKHPEYLFVYAEETDKTVAFVAESAR